MDFGFRKAQPGPAGATDVVKNATTASFVADVLEPSKTMPIVVDFWAPWCAPCKQLTPVIEKVVKGYGGKVRLVKVNVDDNQAIAQQLQVKSLPTVYAFRDGQPIDGFVGVQPESAIKAFVDRLLDDGGDQEMADVLQTGEDLLEQGDLQGAAEVYASILQEDRENAQALAGLAQCYLRTGDTARARQTLSLVSPDKRNLAAVLSTEAAIDLAEKGAGTSDLAGLKARIAADPRDQQARFDLAVGYAAKGHKAEAIDLLLELIRMDRKWDDEAGRRQLLQLFEAWGPKEPLVADGRRRLSSILFS